MTDITHKGRIAEKTAVALGFFDGLHLGHIEVIKAALAHRQYKSAVFTFSGETLLPKFKKSENLITHEQKRGFLEEIGVDYIFAPDFAEVREMSAERFVEEILVKRLNSAVITCGYDFHFGKGGRADAGTLAVLCKGFGVRTEIIPAVTVDKMVVSSSYIRQLVREGRIEEANRFLGYELTYDLTVVEGNRLGRTLGFPTINQVIPDTGVTPRFGVYKSWTIAGGKTYQSITDIGVKPTVTEGGSVVMETHIVGFDGDLYGEKVKVVLRSFLRPEEKFADTEELRRSISRDIQCL